MTANVIKKKLKSGEDTTLGTDLEKLSVELEAARLLKEVETRHVCPGPQ